MAVVTELGSDVDPLVLHLDAALAEKECALRAAFEELPPRNQNPLGQPEGIQSRKPLLSRSGRRRRLQMRGTAAEVSDVTDS